MIQAREGAFRDGRPRGPEGEGGPPQRPDATPDPDLPDEGRPLPRANVPPAPFASFASFGAEGGEGGEAPRALGTRQGLRTRTRPKAREGLRPPPHPPSEGLQGSQGGDPVLAPLEPASPRVLARLEPSAPTGRGPPPPQARAPGRGHAPPWTCSPHGPHGPKRPHASPRVGTPYDATGHGRYGREVGEDAPSRTRPPPTPTPTLEAHPPSGPSPFGRLRDLGPSRAHASRPRHPDGGSMPPRWGMPHPQPKAPHPPEGTATPWGMPEGRLAPRTPSVVHPPLQAGGKGLVPLALRAPRPLSPSPFGPEGGEGGEGGERGEEGPSGPRGLSVGAVSSVGCGPRTSPRPDGA